MDKTNWDEKYIALESKIKTLCGSDSLDEGLNALSSLVSDFHNRYPDLPSRLHLSTINKCISGMKSEQEWKREHLPRLYEFLQTCTSEQRKTIDEKIKWLISIPYIGSDYFASQYNVCIESYIAHQMKKI